MNKKGFTLVELLAVIVILAIVMLIAVTAIGPIMSKSRKGALGNEGIFLVDAAKTAFQAEQLSANSAVKSNSSVCFDLEWLYSNNYFEKGAANSYTGSVLAEQAGNGKVTYHFWISNGSYAFVNATVDYNIDDATVVKEEASASTDCGASSLTGLVKCTGSNACA